MKLVWLNRLLNYHNMLYPMGPPLKKKISFESKKNLLIKVVEFFKKFLLFLAFFFTFYSPN